jgi:chorismate--pyruvate lyase
LFNPHRAKRHIQRHERWHPTDSQRLQTIPLPARHWLALRTSLTAHLGGHFGDTVKVRVLSERHDRFLASERELLGVSARSGRIREVQLEVRGQPYVVARTVFPSSTARGLNRGLLKLGNRALGSLLFGAMRAPAMMRQFASLTPHSSSRRTLQAHLPHAATQLWARRALHVLHGRPLLVTEIFLPTVFATRPANDQPASPALIANEG